MRIISNCLMALVLSSMFVACKTEKDAVRANEQINEWLYGVEYDDYDVAGAIAFYEKRSYPAGLCSEVRKGNFVGRNLDWYINRDASGLVKVNAKNPQDAASLDSAKLVNSRFASISMCGCNPLFSVDLAKKGEYERVYEILPYATTDGINENGVYIGVNVTATGETSCDETKWHTGGWGLGATGNERVENHLTLCVTLLPRIVLNHATSVEHAKQLLRSINWYEPANFPTKGQTQAFHFLICDSVASTVCEFLDGDIVFVDAENINEPGYGTIMTNFNNSLMARENPIYQHTGCGYERYDLIKAQYPAMDVEKDGAAAVEKVMQSVWYSNAYTIPVGSDNFWFSEKYNTSSPKMYAGNLYAKGKEMWNDAGFVQRVKHDASHFADKSVWHEVNCNLWYTTHTSIYNIKERSLRVLVHEGFDGQKDYYEVGLDATFPKPLELSGDFKK